MKCPKCHRLLKSASDWNWHFMQFHRQQEPPGKSPHTECSRCAQMIRAIRDLIPVIESEINPKGRNPSFPTVYLKLLPRLQKIVGDEA